MGSLHYKFTGSEISLPIVYSGGFHNYSYSVKLHSHKHMEGPEITYILKGSTQWRLENGKEIEQPGGTLTLIPRGIGHLGAGELISPCWLYWYVLDLRNPQEACRNTPFSTDEIELIFQILNRRSCSVASVQTGMKELFQHLLELLKKGHANKWYAAEMRLIMCQIILNTAKSIADTRMYPDDLLAINAREFMRKNLCSDISVDDIAAACGLSESQFARRFKRAAGITPADYLQRLRIEEGARLLRESNRSITTIAFELGFSSSQYFSTVFKRYTRQTPQQFRKR